MNILVTAIGSMSASCVISSLKKSGHMVVGCDIYPGQWHYETKLCDFFYQCPLSKSVGYIDFLKELVKIHHIQYLIPLTDIEVDVLSDQHSSFESLKCVICTSSTEVIKLVRNKFEVYNFFKDNTQIPSIPTYSTDNNLSTSNFYDYPYIAKPLNGRSSEGIVKVFNNDDLKQILNKQGYLIQRFIEGSIFTVDVVRKSKTNQIVAIPRVELLRTSNGAGLTVQLSNNIEVIRKAEYIAEQLDINGCINMEFIYHKNTESYYLIDINPRFSAGIAFSNMTGNDFVINHLSCFDGSIEFLGLSSYKEVILTKRYQEEVLL